MRKTPALLGCAFLAMLTVGSALAAPVTVKITGHITGWSNPGNLNGIAMGQPVTATYTYNTDTPDQDPSSTVGRYQPSASQASVSFSTEVLQYESQSTTTFDLFVQQAPSPGLNWLGMQIASSDSHLPVQLLTFDIWNFSGYAPPSDALPTGAPDLSLFSTREINLYGMDENFNSFQLTAAIDTAEVVAGIEVSPAAGHFLPQQHFDAALLLPPGSTVVSANASAGGSALPLSYPGTCQLVSSPRPAVLCPDAHAALAVATSSEIHWSVELADGTVLHQTVDWSLVQ